ncbi:transcription factor CP2-like protein 1 isoform X2 [Cylas formicarius]|nr:transcription factor CP2-like protein 1 isoform X2 [Cylas formicarius]
MPQWQVEEYGDINQDIDSSLNLTPETGSGQYVSDHLLTITGMTVFKQEAPSPTAIGDVAQLQMTHQNRQSPTSTQPGTLVNTVNNSIEDGNQNVFNNTINQLLSQSALANLHNVIESNNLSPSSNSQDNYAVSSTNYNLIEDCRFQYVLAAATSIATKQNEDTLTYLNQGQSYEIKLKKLGDLSMYRGKMLKSIVRICFHERRLQYMEKEQLASWQRTRPGDRILEADIPLSYGAFDIIQPTNAVNVVHFVWDPTKEVGVYIKVNCISTEFTPKKHGGEKGVPFRIQVETYQNGDNITGSKRLHAAACQIKVFKLKGADRKHKQDKEKIMKRPLSEQEKYQPSYDCTVLNDIPSDVVLCHSPVPTNATLPIIESGSDVSQPSQIPQNDNTTQNQQPFGQRATPALPLGQINSDKKDDFVVTQDNSADIFEVKELTKYATPVETAHWLTLNRFDKYLETFASFSGSDMLRMSRDDLIQICGHADGIRMHNILHTKTIAPKLKIYVCRENASIFYAIFLSSHDTAELLRKLAALVAISQDHVRDIYVEGPQGIHIQLNEDVLQHIDDEAMFTLTVVQDNGSFLFLLKRKIK